ncbi:MAG: sulfite exporter TauE/SafE family protein [Firmicutes bacterium]|nr:sulfite exporter TauE/SafE family protein [Bacillota bacterium]
MSMTVVLVGLLVGTLVGLTGVGGGSLLTPILIWMGVPVSTSIGTDLVSNAATKLLGLFQHHRQRSVSWRWVFALAVTGVPAALLGTWAVAWLHTRPETDGVLKHILGAALVLATLATVAQGWVRRRAPRGAQAAPGAPAGPGVTAGPSVAAPGSQAADADAAPPLDEAAADGRPGRLVYVFGALVGFMVGLTSVGGGALVAPVLFLLSRLSPRRIVGTDIGNAFFLTVAAGAAHAAIGTVNLPLALNLMLGSLPGVWLGSRLTLVVPRRPLRAVISGIVLVTGVRWLV